MQTVKILVSVLSAALPVVEAHWYSVLPVSDGLRNGLLPIAVLTSLAAVVAGVATARQSRTGEALVVGWLSLCVFFGTTITLYGFMDFLPRAAGGLYVLFFAAFALAMASFLASRNAERI